MTDRNCTHLLNVFCLPHIGGPVKKLSRLLPPPLSGAQGHQAAHHYAHLSTLLQASALHWTHLYSITFLIASPISVYSSVSYPCQHYCHYVSLVQTLSLCHMTMQRQSINTDMDRDRNSVSKLILKTKTIQCSNGEQSRELANIGKVINRWWVSPGESNNADVRDEGWQVCVMQGNLAPSSARGRHEREQTWQYHIRPGLGVP